MDSEVTNLSQVKAFDSSDYATAAQGTKADSAQQPPSEGAFANGDKTKLDGIEASADVTDTANVTAAGALMDSELASIADVKALDQSVISGSSPNFTTANMSDASNKRFMTDAQESKLDAIEANATADQTKADINGLAITTVGTIDTGVWNGTAIASAYIADNAITGAKIALGSDAAGDIMYYNGTDYVRLGIGSDGQVLTVNDAGNAPQWEDASGGGGGGDITSVVAGDGLTGGATTGDATLNVVGGDGITANANDVAITAAQTTITSVYNASLKMGRDSENLIDFATTDNKIILRANNVDQVSLIDNVFGPEADSDVDLGTSAKRWKDAYVDSITVTGNTDVDGDLDVDGTTNLDAVDIDGNVQLDGTLTVGVDDTGKDVKFYGARSGSYVEWDESENRLHLVQGAYVNQPVPATGSTTENATLEIDLSKGNYFNILLGADITAVEFQNATIGQKFIIRFIQRADATAGHGISWSTVRINGSVAAELKWASNIAPTMTGENNTDHRSHKDVYGFLCTATGGSANDTKFDGFIIGQDIPD